MKPGRCSGKAWSWTCGVGLLLASSLTLAAQARTPAVPDAAATRDYAQGLLSAVRPDGAGLALLVVRGEDVLLRDVRGMASIELGVPLDPAQRFRIGSVTKQFAAAALLQLVDAGKLKLDDSLVKLLPDYPNAAAISVRQLLDHTSGVSSYTSIPGYFSQRIRVDLDTAGMIDVFKDLKPDFEPGKGWNYSNSGYVLVGAVIEQIAGKPWHAQVAQMLKPLGLAQTAYEDNQLLHRGLVNGYSGADQGTFVPAPYLSMTQPHAAGALISTLDDLHRWNRALHGGKLLSTSSYTAMITPEGEAVKSNYGLGISASTLRGEPVLQHGGGINGFASMLMYLPQSQISVVVLSNSTGGDTPEPSDLARKLAAFALGKPYTEPKPVALSPAQREEMLGVYRIDATQARTIRLDGEQLTSQRTGGSRLKLIPLGDDRFQFEDSMSAFALERDAAGKIKGMRFWADGFDEGTAQFATLTDEQATVRTAIQLPRAALERLVGQYSEARLNFVVAWSEDDKGITAQIPGQPALLLHASSANEFFLKEVDASIVFAPEQGAVKTATLKQGGMEVELMRK